jgi:uncharacterized protein
MSATLVRPTTSAPVDTQRGTAVAQYSLAQVLAIWAAAALPMGILGWIVAPALAPDIRSDPVGAVLVRYGVLTLGLIWMFVLSMILVYREEGNLRWTTLRGSLRLNTPREPRSGDPRRRLWLWAIPLLVLVAVWGILVGPRLAQVWGAVFPALAEPAGFALGNVLATPGGRELFAGAWAVLALFALNALFNSVLGEELLFRGVLLPRMGGVFGRWDWVANGVLFGLYHLHQPWSMLGSIGSGALLYALPAKQLRSTWMSIIVHSGQTVYFLIVILVLVRG